MLLWALEYCSAWESLRGHHTLSAQFSSGSRNHHLPSDDTNITSHHDLGATGGWLAFNRRSMTAADSMRSSDFWFRCKASLWSRTPQLHLSNAPEVLVHNNIQTLDFWQNASMQSTIAVEFSILTHVRLVSTEPWESHFATPSRF